MTSILPFVIPPTSSDISPPPELPASSSSNSLTTSPFPTSFQPNQTTDPSSFSAPSNSSSPSPSPQTSHLVVLTAPPPSPSLSLPSTLTTPPVSPAPSTAASPPSSPLASPPLSLLTSPSPSPSPPPSPPIAPPPLENSPPSPVLSPPLPLGASPPPHAAPAPSVVTSPLPQVISRFPPPPANVPTPPSSKSPPSPTVTPPPESFSLHPKLTPPPSSSKFAQSSCDDYMVCTKMKKEKGGFGCAYKGILTDGREVAVKQLKIGGGQGEREFRAEVEIISRVHHCHLVSLVGYCLSGHQKLLVYDYVPNNTLHYHLHDHPRIIHRDIKSSNILLDNNFEAQVSDFGLAKLFLDSNTHVTTRVMGTFGYMAPEYATSGKLTEKSDVYSFGVVLLELITGHKPVDDSQPLGDESLVEWARPLLVEVIEHQDLQELMDPRLEKNYMDHEMFRMIEAAATCVQHSAAKRPRMSQVGRALDSLDESSDLTNGIKPGQSEVFDSAQQSAQIRLFQSLAFDSQDYSSSFFNHTQSSWRSQEDGSQGSWRSREYGN
ncbi:hypothetical protein CRYUN_Cryun14cG0066800 [Craigia yunnanensis]